MDEDEQEPIANLVDDMKVQFETRKDRLENIHLPHACWKNVEDEDKVANEDATAQSTTHRCINDSPA
jgi:hypothetical protein